VPKGHVDDAEAEFSTPLKFIEENWGPPYLTRRIRVRAAGNGLTHSAGACR
jgi:hypothetical protein